MVGHDDAYTGLHSQGVVELAITRRRSGRSRRARPAQRRVRRAPARRRQGRDPERADQQARPAERARVDHRPHPHDRGSADPREDRWADELDRHGRPLLARALRRHRLPRRARRRADPDRVADHRRLRRLQRDDDRPPLPRRDVDRGRDHASSRTTPAPSSIRRSWSCWWPGCANATDC